MRCVVWTSLARAAGSCRAESIPHVMCDYESLYDRISRDAQEQIKHGKVSIGAPNAGLGLIECFRGRHRGGRNFT